VIRFLPSGDVDDSARASGGVFEFGPFRLEPAERRLSRDGRPVALTPKCFDLLVALVENSGHLLSKEQLLQRVWPDQFVEESSLSFNISELRRLLGDEPSGVGYIQTVRKKGFRFVAGVKKRHGSEPDQIGGDVPFPSRDADDERATIPDGAEVPANVTSTGASSMPHRRSLIRTLIVVALALSAYVFWMKHATTVRLAHQSGRSRSCRSDHSRHRRRTSRSSWAWPRH
jgi:DNA-binding winged helix-turn-helix (wHTH) protein